MIVNIPSAKELREDADYYDEWSKISAQELLTKAEQFLVKAKEISNINAAKIEN